MSSESSPLLLQLRNGNYRWQADPKQGFLLLAKHQSEFPARIRRTIQDTIHRWENTSDPKDNVMMIFNSVRDFFLCSSDEENTEIDESAEWYGPDIEVDTEDEIEVSIRFFPEVLKETKALDEIWEWLFYPIFWATTSLKSLPFVPLIAELGHEYQLFPEKEQGGILNAYQMRKGSPLLQIITNKFILKKEAAQTEEFNHQVDDVSLSVLVRLKEKGFVRKKDAWDCIKNLLNETPSRTNKRISFFINWDPSMLQIKNNSGVDLYQRRFGTSLLDEFLKQFRKRNDTPDIMFERFQTLIELGLKYYPEEIGFLFHKDDMSYQMTCSIFGVQNVGEAVNSYQSACDIFGEQKVSRIANDTILQYTQGEGDTIQDLVYSAATNEKILLDGVYTLVRGDPNALASLFSKKNAMVLTTAEETAATYIIRENHSVVLTILLLSFMLCCISGFMCLYYLYNPILKLDDEEL